MKTSPFLKMIIIILWLSCAPLNCNRHAGRVQIGVEPEKISKLGSLINITINLALEAGSDPWRWERLTIESDSRNSSIQCNVTSTGPVRCIGTDGMEFHAITQSRYKVRDAWHQTMVIPAAYTWCNQPRGGKIITRAPTYRVDLVASDNISLQVDGQHGELEFQFKEPEVAIRNAKVLNSTHAVLDFTVEQCYNPRTNAETATGHIAYQSSQIKSSDILIRDPIIASVYGYGDCEQSRGTTLKQKTYISFSCTNPKDISMATTLVNCDPSSQITQVHNLTRLFSTCPSLFNLLQYLISVVMFIFLIFIILVMFIRTRNRMRLEYHISITSPGETSVNFSIDSAVFRAPSSGSEDSDSTISNESDTSSSSTSRQPDTPDDLTPSTSRPPDTPDDLKPSTSRQPDTPDDPQPSTSSQPETGLPLATGILLVRNIDHQTSDESISEFIDISKQSTNCQ